MGNKPMITLFRDILGPESDGIVTVSGGWVEGQTDFLVTQADHTFMMWRPRVLRAMERFLKEGSFLSHKTWAMDDSMTSAPS